MDKWTMVEGMVVHMERLKPRADRMDLMDCSREVML